MTIPLSYKIIDSDRFNYDRWGDGFCVRDLSRNVNYNSANLRKVLVNFAVNYSDDDAKLLAFAPTEWKKIFVARVKTSPGVKRVKGILRCRNTTSKKSYLALLSRKNRVKAVKEIPTGSTTLDWRPALTDLLETDVYSNADEIIELWLNNEKGGEYIDAKVSPPYTINWNFTTAEKLYVTNQWTSPTDLKGGYCVFLDPADPSVEFGRRFKIWHADNDPDLLIGFLKLEDIRGWYLIMLQDAGVTQIRIYVENATKIASICIWEESGEINS